MYFFIYETTNLINGKKYRGMHATENVNDNYLGSGTLITKAVKKYGDKNFKREILEYCNSEKEMFDREKFYVDEEWIKREDTYNLQLGGIGGALYQESKNKISNTLKEKYKTGEIKQNRTYYPLTDDHKNKISKSLKSIYNTEIHHNTNKEPWNKGKKNTQIAWNKGLKMPNQTEESNLKRSNTLKERYLTQDHHSKGTEPWNKGKKGSQTAWNKGLSTPKIQCPHCNKQVDIGNLKRWHLDNCRYKKN